MNTESISTFLILAEERSVKKTAQRLFVAQSTVSSRLRELEKELGQTLFERKPRSMTLTPAGQRLIAPARKMMDSRGPMVTIHPCRFAPYWLDLI